jgi:hypothetical protein
MTAEAHRPQRINFRANPRWEELFPHLKELGIELLIQNDLPSIAKWVRVFGHIEIGDQEGFGFVVRAIDPGGVVFESDKPDTLAEALAALKKGLAGYFQREGIEEG